jgi:phosphoglycerate dehydrogenase-like enzyme
VKFARIVMLDFEEHDFAPAEWRTLRESTGELDRCRSGDPELLARVADADCLLVQLGVAVTPELVAAAPRLRYVGVFGTSTGRIDVGARREVCVRNVAGFSTQAVAEFAIAAVLEHLRDLSGARHRAARRDFAETSRHGGELRGRRFGVVGLGAIGRRVAEIASRGFGARVQYWSRTARPESGFERVELDRLLAESEVLAVHLALTHETRGILDARRVARIAGGALLVHLAPPELLDVEALVERVRAGSLHFITDHADEMEASYAADLSRLDACTLYPPIAYGTREATHARRERFLANLQSFLASPR